MLDVFFPMWRLRLLALPTPGLRSTLVTSMPPKSPRPRMGGARPGRGARMVAADRLGNRGLEMPSTRWSALAGEGRWIPPGPYSCIRTPPVTSLRRGNRPLEGGLRATRGRAPMGCGLRRRVVAGACFLSHPLISPGSARPASRHGKAGEAGRLLRTGFAAPDHPENPANMPRPGYLKALTSRLKD